MKGMYYFQFNKYRIFICSDRCLQLFLFGHTKIGHHLCLTQIINLIGELRNWIQPGPIFSNGLPQQISFFWLSWFWIRLFFRFVLDPFCISLDLSWIWTRLPSEFKLDGLCLQLNLHRTSAQDFLVLTLATH